MSSFNHNGSSSVTMNSEAFGSVNNTVKLLGQ